MPNIIAAVNNDNDNFTDENACNDNINIISIMEITIMAMADVSNINANKHKRDKKSHKKYGNDKQ